MEKFSAESVECIINNEETVWEEFKQTMEIWAEKLGEYGIDSELLGHRMAEHPKFPLNAGHSISAL